MTKKCTLIIIVFFSLTFSFVNGQNFIIKRTRWDQIQIDNGSETFDMKAKEFSNNENIVVGLDFFKQISIYHNNKVYKLLKKVTDYKISGEQVAMVDNFDQISLFYKGNLKNNLLKVSQYKLTASLLVTYDYFRRIRIYDEGEQTIINGVRIDKEKYYVFKNVAVWQDFFRNIKVYHKNNVKKLCKGKIQKISFYNSTIVILLEDNKMILYNFKMKKKSIYERIYSYSLKKGVLYFRSNGADNHISLR